jgi:hypothetical protein
MVKSCRMTIYMHRKENVDHHESDELAAVDTLQPSNILTHD